MLWESCKGVVYKVFKCIYSIHCSGGSRAVATEGRNMRSICSQMIDEDLRGGMHGYNQVDRIGEAK